MGYAKVFPALTREQIYKPLQTRKFWETVKPKPYAQQYLKALCDCGFDVYLCTSSDYRSIKIKYETVIMKYFPYIPWEKIIITSRKQMIKADFLIDDAVHNLEGGSYKKILMTAPHNKNYNAEENGMFRVNDWREIYSLLYHIGLRDKTLSLTGGKVDIQLDENSFKSIYQIFNELYEAYGEV